MSYIPRSNTEAFPSDKGPVRVASTTNITLTAPGSTIDSVTLAVNDRVLLKNQTTTTQNGIYLWNGAAVTMSRAEDANSNAEVIPGLSVYVEEGTVNQKTLWTLITPKPIILGTTALTFEDLPAGTVAAHLADPTDAHAGTAISVDSTTLLGTSITVQGALDEIDNVANTATTDIANHIADTSAAHAASAVSVDSTTLVGTGTTVQAVFEEMDNDIAALTAASGIPASIVDVKGDIIAASAADTPVRVAAGADGLVPTYDDASTAGVTPRYPAMYSGMAVHRANGGSALASTIDPMTPMTGVGLTDGVCYFAALYLPFDATLTGVFWIPSATGVFTADNNNKVGLYTRSAGTLTRVAQSTSDAATFKTPANVYATRAFSATYAATAGVYYVAMLRNLSADTTNPIPYGISVSPGAQTLGVTAGRGVCGFVSGQTDLPASTTMTDHDFIRFCGVY